MFDTGDALVATLAMRELILGVDPGFTGSLAVINSNTMRLVEVIDMPLMKPSNLFERKHRPEIDVARLAAWVDAYAHKIQLAVLEKVSAAPDQGVVSMFRFGEGYGMVRGVVAAHKLRTVTPAPAVWKGAMNLNRNKTRSIEAAKLLAGAEPFLTLMKHHGRAEAILLAMFGARSLAKPNPVRESANSGGDIRELF